MPEVDGLELLKNLKKHPQYKKIPVLMIAAERDLEKVAESLSSGANDFLCKPFDENALEEKMRRIWNHLK